MMMMIMMMIMNNKNVLGTGARFWKVSLINKLYKLSKCLVRSPHGKPKVGSQGKLKKKTP